MGTTLDTVWILHNLVLPSIGVGDLHALEASSPLLVHLARAERLRKNKLQVVIYVPPLRFNHPVADFDFISHDPNMRLISKAMAGLRYCH